MIHTTTHNPLRTLCCAALLIAAAHASAEDVRLEGAALGEWTMDYDAALELAKTESLPLLLNFTGSDWCGYCIQMNRDVFSTDTWQDYAAKHLVLVTLDFPRDKKGIPKAYQQRNEKLLDRFGVRGYPTYILLAADGEEVLGRVNITADVDTETFINDINGALRFSDSSIDRVAGHLPEADAARYRALLGDFRSTRKELDTWLDSGPLRNEESEATFHAFTQKLLATDQEARGLATRAAIRALADEEMRGAYTTTLSEAQALVARLEELQATVNRTRSWLSSGLPENTEANRARLAAAMEALRAQAVTLTADAP